LIENRKYGTKTGETLKTIHFSILVYFLWST